MATHTANTLTLPPEPPSMPRPAIVLTLAIAATPPIAAILVNLGPLRTHADEVFAIAGTLCTWIGILSIFPFLGIDNNLLNMNTPRGIRNTQRAIIGSMSLITAGAIFLSMRTYT